MRIVLGVTGGIAAYKACVLTSLLKKRGDDVRVVMTEHAKAFVSPLTFETLSGYRVDSDLFHRTWEIAHISLAQFAELMVVAPATANFLGKYANGIADDLLSTTVMATRAPVLVAPAMNAGMWRSAANQANVRTLQARGVPMIGPAEGRLACGDSDIGRMVEPEDILAAIERWAHRTRDFAGKTVLVTAGPTREMLDPVRFLSNRSSGKMGVAIAEAARDRGAQVELILGPTALSDPPGVHVTHITSTQALYDAAMVLAPHADVVIQSAAPADFTPVAYTDHKIQKTGEGMTISLRATPDVARRLGEMKRPGQVLVAFAAETEPGEARAREKLARKNADLVVLNDVTEPGAGFQGDTNRVTLITADGAEPLPLMSKRDVAERLLDRVLTLS